MYGRSLYSFVCGLFTARWGVMTLGEEDYGLIGVVGEIVGFLMFFDGLGVGAVARFYAFAVGQVKVAQDERKALEVCRMWFNAAGQSCRSEKLQLARRHAPRVAFQICRT